MSDITPRVGSNSLPDLASRIVREHEAIQKAPHVVLRAISLGNLLIEAKNHDGQYGKWSTWLKDNCKEMSDRTAQRYMDLAINEKDLRAKLPWQRSPETIRHTVADLTLNEACGLIKPPRKEKQRNYHNDYVAAEDKLIEKLQLLSPAAIREVAEVTNKRLRAAVADLTKA
jgi:hypothetical protein